MGSVLAVHLQVQKQRCIPPDSLLFKGVLDPRGIWDHFLALSLVAQGGWVGVPLFGRAQGWPARGTCCCRSPCAGSNRVAESPRGDADALGSDLAARGARPRAGERKEARRPARRWPLGTLSPPPVRGRAFDPADGAAPLLPRLRRPAPARAVSGVFPAPAPGALELERDLPAQRGQHRLLTRGEAAGIK